MHTENEIVIQADVGAIYPLAAAVERWPTLLPHYRWVRVLEEEGHRRLVEMAAHRDGIPVRWWAEQVCYPEEPRITFRHVRGVTRGMEVEWHFTALPVGVRVGIRHDLSLGWPLIGGLVAERIIGPHFVANIAGKTLRRIKALAEVGGGDRPPDAPGG
jgi:ribosome-associated toxin RatA of RatAB toxin-antitoxin module